MVFKEDVPSKSAEDDKLMAKARAHSNPMTPLLQALFKKKPKKEDEKEVKE
jgi:hypothetical protein